MPLPARPLPAPRMASLELILEGKEMVQCVEYSPCKPGIKVQISRTHLKLGRRGSCLAYQHLEGRDGNPRASWLARLARIDDLQEVQGETLPR